MNKIYNFVSYELFTGRTNAFGGPHEARVFETPDLNQKIYGKHSLTFIDMNGRRFASDLGKEDVAQVKNSGHELQNFALQIFKQFKIRTVVLTFKNLKYVLLKTDAFITSVKIAV